MTHNSTLATRLGEVRERLRRAEQQFARPTDSVQLLAVSKTRPASDVRACARLGQRLFGESYLQEALDKMLLLEDLDLEWHFIGPLQSNKTRPVAEHFAWVHSVDRLKVARRLSEQRPRQLPDLNICLQVNISGESSKSGVGLAELPRLAAEVADLPRLRLRGLMAIPAAESDFDRQRAAFRQLRQALEALRAEGFDLATLSMGMTDDLEAAVAEGATMVRIGTALFGPRSLQTNGHLLS